MSTEQTKQRLLIVDKHLKNPTLSNRKLAKSLKISRRTVDTALKRFTEQKTIQRKQGSDRKKRTANPRALERLETSLEEHPDWSDRYRAKKLKVSNFFVHKWRQRLGNQSFKVVKMPNRNDKQNSTAKSRARKLYDNLLTKHNVCILMDDETYVKMDFKQIPGQCYYASKIRGNVSDKYKYVITDKFSKKLMIWQALCSCGKKSPIHFLFGHNEIFGIREMLSFSYKTTN